MKQLIPIALLGWPVITLMFFGLCTARRAATLALLGGWLFLPDAVSVPLRGFGDVSKINSIGISILLATAIFDVARFTRLRPRPVDLFAVVWCLCPFLSSISNDLGPYDGLQAVSIQVQSWGLSYLVGRLYYADYEGMTELARGMVVAGLIYVPLCLVESRLSPQLNQWVYGYYAYDWAGGARRLGGWRPSVFMRFGLELGLWMACVSLVSVWLWVNGTRVLLGMPMLMLMGAQVLTTVLCRSLGSLVLMFAAVGAMLLSRWLRVGLLVWFMMLIPLVYPLARSTDAFSGKSIVSIAESVSKDRAASLDFRLRNEDILVDKALQRPLVGWGRWGRARVYDERGQDISTTDGLWIIYLGSTGWIGLGSLTLMMLAPGALVMLELRRYRLWAEPALAPVAALVLIPIVYMIDSLPNGFVNPVYTAIAGGLAGWVMPAFAYARQPVAQATPSPTQPELARPTA